MGVCICKRENEREELITLCPQVLWEVVPDLNPPLLPFTDLLFLGLRGSTVSETQSRSDTGTVALQFNGDSDSIVTISSGYHPPIITNKLTIRLVLYTCYTNASDAYCCTLAFPSLWLMVTGGSTGGVLVAKSSGSTIFYGLTLLPNGGDFLISFSYLPASRTVL